MLYGVAFFPDLSLKVEIVGPFRSIEMAKSIYEKLIIEIDSKDADGYLRVTQVVTFISIEEAIKKYSDPIQ